MGIGDTDAALTSLERAADEHDIGLTAGFWVDEKMWDPIRGNPRFWRLLERLNLAQYFRGSTRRSQKR